MDKQNLIITYQTIKQIMEETENERNTSFVCVKNFLANMICDMLIDGEIINGNKSS